jgi:hypothetical protein
MKKNLFMFVLFLFMTNAMFSQTVKIDLSSNKINDVNIFEINTSNYSKVIKGNYVIKTNNKDTSAINSTQGITFNWRNETNSSLSIDFNLIKSPIKLQNISISKPTSIEKLNFPESFKVLYILINEEKKRLIFISQFESYDIYLRLTTRILTEKEFKFYQLNGAGDKLVDDNAILKAKTINIENLMVSCALTVTVQKMSDD